MKSDNPWISNLLTLILKSCLSWNCVKNWQEITYTFCHFSNYTHWHSHSYRQSSDFPIPQNKALFQHETDKLIINGQKKTKAMVHHSKLHSSQQKQKKISHKTSHNHHERVTPGKKAENAIGKVPYNFQWQCGKPHKISGIQ